MWIPLFVLICAALMVAVETARPGRAFPKVAGWWARAALLNGVQVLMVLLGGWFLDDAIRALQPWRAEPVLGVTGAAVVGYLTITFIYYWWHRWRHRVPILWRVFHQVHHSPQRIEVITSFYKHPAEIFVNALLSSAILYLLVGCGPASASAAVLLTGLAELFYHWNITTPRWLGWFFQRPEMHCVHHQEHRHSSNYSDLPLWDLLFGTFHNPAVFDATCGFGDDEQRFGEMLATRDLTPRLKEKAIAAKRAREAGEPA